ncbi:MAG: hypothetical protein WCX65_13995 [bacterium]
MKSAFRALVFAGITLAALTLRAYPANAADKSDKIDASNIVVVDPRLAPSDSETLKFNPDVPLEQQVRVLFEEVGKLRMMATRATLILTADLELAPKEERRVTFVLTGGPLEKPVTCKSNEFGVCVFIVEPLKRGIPDYNISIKMNRYKNAEKSIRVSPGAIAVIPIRVEMTPAEHAKRISPPPINPEK